jgi:predicted transport protein
LISALDDLLKKVSESIKSMFKELRSKILELDENINEKATLFYVAYRVTKNFAEIHVGKNQIKIHLRPIDYDDPDGRIEKIREGYNWTLDRRLYLKTEADIEYVLSLLEQSYKDVM